MTYPSPIVIALISMILAGAVCLWIFFWSSFAKRRNISLSRHHGNPVISPCEVDWKNCGTFNPAAVQDDDGVVHLLYRAIGGDGVSRFGYARSEDGRKFGDHDPYPVFTLRNARFGRSEVRERFYNPNLYGSGGSWGGSEDPRMVRIDGRVYVTFNAFDSWENMRVALISASEKDFFSRKWNWREAILISPEKKRNKNWVLFPEKINDKFAILHGIAPNIRVEYVTFLEELAAGKKMESSHDHGGAGYYDKSRKDYWDTYVRSAGPPPIKTDKGWLLIYHSKNKKNSNIGYSLGAMLLDIHDPKKIIARSPAPILCPDEWYENDWKAGVVYACGAVVKDGSLLVYYGGGDKHVCVAETPLEPLLDWLINSGKI